MALARIRTQTEQQTTALIKSARKARRNYPPPVAPTVDSRPHRPPLKADRHLTSMPGVKKARELVWMHDWQSDAEVHEYRDAARVCRELTSVFTLLQHELRKPIRLEPYVVLGAGE